MFQINRPVHLARRDVFFARAVELIYVPLQEMTTASRLHHMAHVLALLRTALSHAAAAMRAGNALPREREFTKVLQLILDNVQSVHAMMGHQFQLESEDGFLAQFLGTTHEDSLVPAMHYQRRAEDILQGLWHVLRLADVSWGLLKKKSLETLNAAARSRYDRAAASFEEEVRGKYVIPSDQEESNGS